MKRSYEFDKKVEKAITYLVENMNSTGKNPKPAMLHSLRVGLYLYRNNYSDNVVVTGLLHDLTEDTDIKIEGIKAEFGRKVAILVEANSDSGKHEDKVNSYKDTFARCSKAGEEALFVKAADILHNLPYYNWPDDDYANQKVKAFIHIAQPIIGKDKTFKKLESEYSKLSSTR